MHLAVYSSSEGTKSLHNSQEYQGSKLRLRTLYISLSIYNMSWTERLVGLKPLAENANVNTRVFHYTTKTDYGDEVVIKQVSCPAGNDVCLRKAEDEAKIALAHPHPHITPCLGFVREDNPAGGHFVYIFSPYMVGSLYDDLNRRASTIPKRYYSEDELQGLANQLQDAFCHLQTLNIAHRDIKPHNILLDAEGQAKLCDFGFAKYISMEGESSHSLLFTSGYLSPALREAHIMGDRDHVQHNPFKSDVFSLGVTLAHLSLLALPKPLTEFKNLQQFIDSELSNLGSRYSPRWVEMLRPMLTVKETHRPDFLQLRNPLPYWDDEDLPVVESVSDGQEPLTLTVKCGLEYVRVSTQQTDEVPCMISIKGKDQDPTVRTYGADVMCVIDQSGSMAGGTMDLVKASLIGLLSRLNDRDRMSLVGFHSVATRISPLIRCTPEGKTRLQSFIQSMTCTGATSIARGFLMGLEVLKQRREPNKVASLLLFSDGQDNAGGNPTGTCQAGLEQSKLKEIRICTFGLGSSLDSRLLETLATQGSGQFQHVTMNGQIPQVFNYALGNIISEVATEVQAVLEVKACKVPCKVTKIYSKEGSDTFLIPVFHANEQKELVFLLKPQVCSLANKSTLLPVEVTLTYKGEKNSEFTASEKLKVVFARWEESPAPAKNSEVFRHWFRVRGADYLQRARQLAEDRNFREADELLGRGIVALETSGYTEVPLVMAVLEDMRKAKELVESDKSWSRGGDAHFASLSYSHFSQAATALTPQYASRQQTVPLATIREVPGT